jgi:hypothetical protein
MTVVPFTNGVDPDTIETEFWAFHTAHPEVYNELRDLALRLRRQGRKHYGIKALYEIVRFNHAISARSSADWKLDNNFTCMYARLLMKNEPALADFFRTRRRRAPDLVYRPPQEARATA